MAAINRINLPNAPRTPAGPTSIDWQQYSGPGWTAMAGLASAGDWLNVAAQTCSFEAIAAATNTSGQPTSATMLAAQTSVVQDTLKAIGFFFQCLNIPPLACPTYRTWFTKWFGPVMLVNEDDASHLKQTAMVSGLPNNRNAYGKVADFLAYFSQNGHAQSLNAGTYVCSVQILDHLDESGKLFPGCQGAQACGIGGSFWGAWDVLNNRVPDPNNLNDWSIAAWQNSAPVGAPGGQGLFNTGASQAPTLPIATYYNGILVNVVNPACGIVSAMPARVMYAKALQELVTQLQSQTPLDILTTARTYTLGLNILTAQILGIIPANLFQAQGSLPMLLAQMEQNPTSPVRAQAQAVLTSVGAAAAIAGPYGALLGAFITGVGTLMAQFMPIPVSIYPDIFGRAMPAPNAAVAANMPSAAQPAVLVSGLNGTLPTAAQMLSQLQIPSPPSTPTRPLVTPGSSVERALNGLGFQQATNPHTGQPSTNDMIALGVGAAAIAGLWFFLK